MSRNKNFSSQQNPGEALRKIRTDNGWTLTDVYEKTGLAVSTLSKLETGKMELNYTKLMKLCDGLDLDMSQLFALPDTPAPVTSDRPPRTKMTGRRAITRKGEEPTMSDGPYFYEFHGAELNQRSFHPMVIEVRARSMEEFGNYIKHEGEEFTYILEGDVEFHSEIYAPTVLSEGDSIYFDAGMGHAWIASSPGRCRILAVFTGSSHQHS